MPFVPERRLSLEEDPAAVATARGSVDSLLTEAGVDGPGSDVHDRALLCTSELVANAIEHGAGPVDLHVEFVDAKVRIEVTDHSGRLPAPRRPTSTDVRGRGLLIVGNLADRWGFDPRPEGKTVWCEVAMPG